MPLGYWRHPNSGWPKAPAGRCRTVVVRTKSTNSLTSVLQRFRPLVKEAIVLVLTLSSGKPMSTLILAAVESVTIRDQR